MKIVKSVCLIAAIIISGCSDDFEFRSCAVEDGWYITTSDCDNPRGSDFAFFGNTSYTDGGFKTFVNECNDITYVYIRSTDVSEIVSNKAVFSRVTPGEMAAFEREIKSYDRTCTKFLKSSIRWFG